ncbi:MAG TPA: glycosyl hydrolase, partial [Chitinophagaceae bacterium]
INVEASDDGSQFRLVTTINSGLETELLIGDKYIAFDIPVTKAKYFRLSSSKARRYRHVRLSGITRLKNWMEKANHRSRHIMLVQESSTIHHLNEQKVPEGSIVNVDNIVDISGSMNSEGVMKWKAPAGNWTIVRIGFTPTGTLNRAAPDTGIGLECDKFRKAAISFHFNKMMEFILPFTIPLAAKKKMGLEIDSYEAGNQNWTEGFQEEFKKRTGYDVIKFLPAVAGGRILGSVERTERFLWDLRRVQADLVAENYYGQFHQLCQQHNITSYIEPYDTGPLEEMQIGSKVNVNIGEFWNGVSSLMPIKHPASRTTKLAASISHVNGMNVVGAEAFTAEPDSARWQEHPFAMKAIGDKAFTKGVNRLIVHRFAHQPHPTAAPGMTMGPWGIHFDRTNTWWNQGKAWLNYISRCQLLLQQGQFVADLLYFSGEDANMYTRVNPDELNPSPPEGFDYDLINASVLLHQVKIQDKKIVLSNGMSYRVFVLQDYKIVTHALLLHLSQLVREGMILVGARPHRSAGLADLINEDAEFNQVAGSMWGNINGDSITKNDFGKGSIYWGRSLQSILEELKIDRDFYFSSRSGDAPVIYTHRKSHDADIYFLSNQRRTYEDLVCTFRVRNKQPELWDAATGKIIPVSFYELKNNSVQLPVQLEPYGSVFVVFRSAAGTTTSRALIKENTQLISTRHFPESARNNHKNITNNFTISFWAKPELNVLLNPDFIIGTIRAPWTEYYALYPASGRTLHGAGHAVCGLTVGRNGVAVWEHGGQNPELVLAAPAAVSGWTHVTLVYKAGIPAVYNNGQLVQTGKKSKYTVHPPPDKIYLKEGASFYNGDMSKPALFNEVLDSSRILKLAKSPPGQQASPFIVQMTASNKAALLLKQNGRYNIQNSDGKLLSFTITDIQKPIKISGPWDVRFPSQHGAPEKIRLPELISLHKHPMDGVKYFSGTAVYIKSFELSTPKQKDKRWFLDLGKVEVMAEVILNGKIPGIIWKPPFSIDVTDALVQGINKLEIKVTNLWPNRLIGDEHLTPQAEYTPGGGSSGQLSLSGGYIEKLPDWYAAGKPKPFTGRIAFATWQHYTKTSPLLESGLIGPVGLWQAVVKVL